MALRPSLRLLLLVAALLAAAGQGAAEDSRIEKARQIREELIAKRAPARVLQQPDGFDSAVQSAEARLADIDTRIESGRKRSEAQVAAREKLAAREEELAKRSSAVHDQNRGRVEAIWRSAKLGAGAAGWHPERVKSARLSRYLAAIAAAQQQTLARVEIEHGSAIAALDKARADDAAVADELRVLGADRVEAMAALDRAQQGAPSGDEVASAAASPAESEELGDLSAREIERMAEVARILAGRAKLGDARAAPNATGEAAPATGGFEWPAPVPLDGSAAGSPADAVALQKLADAKAELAKIEAARAEELAKADAAEEVAKAAAAATAKADATKKAEAAAKADAVAKAEATAKAEAAAKAAAAPAVEVASKSAATAAEPEDGEPPDLEEGPAVLAPSTPPAEGADPAADATKQRGFLSRVFGGDDGDADKFATSRGKLPVPVSGKVVANYGQQHKSGATYRGVILRASHSAPIHSVAQGRVSFVGNVPGLGSTVIVSHGDRYHTVYSRLGSVNVKEGDRVGSGSTVGELPSDDADMHFELRDKGKAVDPLPWLKGLPGAPPP